MLGQASRLLTMKILLGIPCRLPWFCLACLAGWWLGGVLGTVVLPLFGVVLFALFGGGGGGGGGFGVWSVGLVCWGAGLLCFFALWG